jgi:hypothetical protein
VKAYPIHFLKLIYSRHGHLSIRAKGAVVLLAIPLPPAADKILLKRYSFLIILPGVRVGALAGMAAAVAAVVGMAAAVAAAVAAADMGAGAAAAVAP